MKLLFTICARAGSKGLKNKNVSSFLGDPLCNYTISVYEDFKRQHSEFDCLLALNTDSLELVEQVKNTGVRFTYIKRREELAGDKVGKIEVIRDTFLQMREREDNCNIDFVIDLDLTSPIRTVEDVKNGLDTMINTPGADCAFSMTQARRSPYFNQVQKQEDGFFKIVINQGAVARQEIPRVFDMNASIYVYRPEYLLKAKKLFDGNLVGFYMKDTAVLDIDSQEDKELMEVMARYLRSSGKWKTEI